MKETAEMEIQESKTRRILGRFWLVLRWLLFFPAGLTAGGLVFYLGAATVGIKDDRSLAVVMTIATATAASIYVSKVVCPLPLVAIVLMALATLVFTLLFLLLGADVYWLAGWLAGVGAATFRTIRSRAIKWKELRSVRWFLFLPLGLGAGLAALLLAFAAGTAVAKAAGQATSSGTPAYAVMTYASIFLGSAVYVLVGGSVAPSYRAVVMLLMANLSYLIALTTSSDFSGRKVFYAWLSWLLGTALGFLPVLLRAAAASQEPWGRAASVVEGKGRRYKGTAPYQDLDLDRKTFFGRERESRHFLNLVLAERLVVLFAKSGMGKSSLINASILEPLRGQGYFPFVVRLNDPGREPLRSLIEGVRRASKEAGVDLVAADESSAWRFFKTAEFWSEHDDLLRPVLVLDQFEELFTLHGPAPRKEFTTQLAELVRGRGSVNREVRSEASPSGAKPPVDDAAPEMKIVIALREDFLANLEDLSAEIPAILHNRFRLGPLSAQAARDAIVEPAGLAGDAFETGRFSYQEAAVERMIAFLAKRRMGTERVEEDEVEPVQLQLICHYLEETVRARQTSQKGEAEIQISEADLGGAEQMQQVMEGFYDRTIASIRPRRKARAVRRLCERRLISGSGRRLTEDEEEIQRRYHISRELLRQLVDARLLRAEPRLGGTSYEVSHDRLVDAIQKSGKRRALRLRIIAAAAVPLFLTVSITQGWRAFERQHKETEIRAHLLETDAVNAIQAATDLVRLYQYDHRKVLGMAEPVLNPSTFAIFTRPAKESAKDSWEWDNTAQAKRVLEHIRRAYPTFLGASANDKEGRNNALALLGAIVSTLDHARTQANIGRSFVTEAGALRAEILEAYRKKFPSTGPVFCGDETSVTVEGWPPLRIQQNLVNVSWYDWCLNPSAAADKSDGNPLLNQIKKSAQPASVSWYEAVAYAALRNGRLPSHAELESARGKLVDNNISEWVSDEEQNRMFRFGFQGGASVVRRSFRVVW